MHACGHPEVGFGGVHTTAWLFLRCTVCKPCWLLAQDSFHIQQELLAEGSATGCGNSTLQFTSPVGLPVLLPDHVQFTTSVDLRSTLAVSPGAEYASLGRRCETFCACPCTVSSSSLSEHGYHLLRQRPFLSWRLYSIRCVLGEDTLVLDTR